MVISYKYEERKKWHLLKQYECGYVWIGQYIYCYIDVNFEIMDAHEN